MCRGSERVAGESNFAKGSVSPKAAGARHHAASGGGRWRKGQGWNWLCGGAGVTSKTFAHNRPKHYRRVQDRPRRSDDMA